MNTIPILPCFFRARCASASLARVLVAITTVAFTALAERVPYPGQREAESTHIVTGEVLDVKSEEKRTTLYGPGTIETHYKISIKVATVEKGQGVKVGDVIQLKAWTLKQRGSLGLAPGPSGHQALPAKATAVRAFVIKTAELAIFDVFYPTGFQPIEAKGK